ncbi:MAG TPA: nitroreductase, partial [Leucothrix mucor]|nr:nitroreductase [Leucothrix mucor]
MNVSEALEQRKSVRSYLDKAVEPEKIRAILDAARHAPSGVNTQPWQVAVVSGNTKQSLQEKIEETFRGGDKGKAEYSYYPTEWKEPF